jgi:hypothetical protein
MVSKNQFVKPDYVKDLAADVDMQVELYDGLTIAAKQRVTPTTTTPTYAYKGDDETPYTEPTRGGEQPTPQSTAGLNPTQIIEWANVVLDTDEKRNNDANVSNLVKCLLFNRKLTVSANGFTIDDSTPAATPIYVCSPVEPTLGGDDAFFSSAAAVALPGWVMGIMRNTNQQGPVNKYETEASLFEAYNTPSLHKRLLLMTILIKYEPDFITKYYLRPQGVPEDAVLLRSDIIYPYLEKTYDGKIVVDFALFYKNSAMDDYNYELRLPNILDQYMCRVKNVVLGDVPPNNQRYVRHEPIVANAAAGANKWASVTCYETVATTVFGSTRIARRTTVNNLALAANPTIGPLLPDDQVMTNNPERSRNLVLGYLANLVYNSTDNVKLAVRDTILKDYGVEYLGPFDPDPVWTLEGNVVKHRIHAFFKKLSDRSGPDDRGRLELYIVFRGSQTKQDWAVTDVQIDNQQYPYSMGRVENISQVIRQIYNAMNVKNATLTPGNPAANDRSVTVYSAGHSLGGFLGLMASSKSYIEQFSGEKLTSDGSSIRFLNKGIIVPIVFNPYLGGVATGVAWGAVRRGVVRVGATENYLTPFTLISSGAIFRVIYDKASKLADSRDGSPNAFRLKVYEIAGATTNVYTQFGMPPAYYSAMASVETAYHGVVNFIGCVLYAETVKPIAQDTPGIRYESTEHIATPPVFNIVSGAKSEGILKNSVLDYEAAPMNEQRMTAAKAAIVALVT